MKILGIDTTTKSASCTVFDGNYYTKSITNDITHSEKLLPIIHETLSEANILLDDIDLLAAINGPGSFTGIRIGLATIKAFAQVKDLNIFSISSIDLISYVSFKNSNYNESYILSLIDAKNNRVYYGLNKLTKDENNKVTIENVLKVDNDIITDALEKIKDVIKDKKIIIGGNCVENLKSNLSSYSSTLLDFYPTTNDLIDCYLSLKEPERYLYNAYSLDALYARPSQAERMSSNG